SASGINAGTIPGPFVLAAPALGGLSYWFAWWVNKQGRVDDLDSSMQIEEVRAACSIINPSAAESSYLESIALLLELPQLDEQTGKDVLAELNLLMMQSGQLAEHRENLRAAINAESLTELISKRDDLRARLAKTQDPDAKAALEQ